MTKIYRRRVYTLGKCEDCGRTKRTTIIVFWLTGLKYRVCASCKWAYRQLAPGPSGTFAA